MPFRLNIDRYGRAVGRVPTLAARLGGQVVVLRKAPLLRIDALTALAPCRGGEPRILGEAPLFVGDALAPLARDGPPFF